jgi:hypothetical protein
VECAQYFKSSFRPKPSTLRALNRQLPASGARTDFLLPSPASARVHSTCKTPRSGSPPTRASRGVARRAAARFQNKAAREIRRSMPQTCPPPPSPARHSRPACRPGQATLGARLASPEDVGRVVSRSVACRPVGARHSGRGEAAAAM